MARLARTLAFAVLSVAFVVLLLRAVGPLDAPVAPAAVEPSMRTGGASVEPAAPDAAAAAQEPASGPMPLPTNPAPERVDRLRLRVERFPDGRPIPGAVVRIEGPGGVLVEGARTSLHGRLDQPLPEDVLSLVVTASAPDFETVEQLVSVGQDVVAVALVPTTGWLGRATTPFGEGVAGARVSAHAYWPPRPAFLELDDGELRLTGTEGTASAGVTAPTNAEGFYYVEPFDDGNVVELVLAVVGTELASLPLHVPLPLPDVWLPDLVARPTAPLEGQVVDEHGRPFVDQTVAIDWSPGATRAAETLVTTGQGGWFAAPRHLGAAHVQVGNARQDFLEASSGSLVLPAEDTWVTVEPDVPRLTATLFGGGHVRGVVRDAASSEPVADARVELWALDDAGQRLVLDSVLSDGQGGFHVVVAPEHAWRALTLDLDAAGYEADDFAVLPRRWDDPPLETLFLVPRPGVSVVAGQVLGPWLGTEEGHDLDVTAWLLPAWATDPLQLVANGFAVPRQDYELLWEGTVDHGAYFSFRTEADPAGTLLLVAETADANGVLRTGTWGPRPLVEATEHAVGLGVQPTSGVDLSLENLPAQGRLLLHQTSWSPLSGRTYTHEREIRAQGEDEQVVEVGLSYLGYAFLELRLERGPVSAPLASTDWIRPGPGRKLALRVGPFHSVQGDIAWYTAADWPDLCIALVGPAVPLWRRDYLGESDWCTRPAPDGRFRFEAVPAGVYTLMLYRPVGTTGVEVLAQRTVTVEHDLYNLDVWSVRPGDELLVTIDL